LRLVDYLKSREITAFFTSLTSGGARLESTETEISSLIDTWLLVRDIELAGERNRGLYVLKSRGMSHSNQIREFVLTDHGIQLLDVYSGPEGVLTGSMRIAQEARERVADVTRRQEIERKKRELNRKRQVLAAQIAALKAEFEAVDHEATILLTDDKALEADFAKDRATMNMRRGGPGNSSAKESKE
jgi:circadian clock protein KaiC